LEGLAEGLAEVCAQCNICGEAGGERDVIIGRFRDPLGVTYGGEERDADARGVNGAFKSNNRHTHAEGIAGGGGAVVREWVKGDIDAIVNIKMVVAVGEGAQEFKAISWQP